MIDEKAPKKKLRLNATMEKLKFQFLMETGK